MEIHGSRVQTDGEDQSEEIREREGQQDRQRDGQQDGQRPQAAQDQSTRAFIGYGIFRSIYNPSLYLAQLTNIIDSVDQSREHIQHKANADIDAASLGFEERLTASDQHFREKEQDLLEINRAMTQPFEDDELEWISADGNRTGTTILGSRMKRFNKTVETNAQELARQLDDWNKCQAELRDMVLQYLGPEGLKQMEEGVFEVGNALSDEFKEFKEEIDAEKKRFANMIKESRNASIKQIKASEEVSDSIDYALSHTDHILIQKLYLRQKKIEEDFLAMLADEEY